MGDGPLKEVEEEGREIRSLLIPFSLASSSSCIWRRRDWWSTYMGGWVGGLMR